MGLLHLWHARHSVPRPHDKKSGAPSRLRICRFEQMESRQFLSVVAPALNVGATYYQPHDGNDSIGSLLYISWNGGAASTSMTDLYIDTHKLSGGDPQFTVTSPVDGDVFFHTAPSSIGGTMAGVPLQVVEWSGTVQPVVTLSNDSTLLHIQFAAQDFQAGGRLVLKVNFDIMQSWSGGQATRVVEGADFDGTSFEAVFSAPHYQTTTIDGFFRNAYADPVSTYALDLPDDNYDNSSAIFTTNMPPAAPPEPIFTAGILASMQQTPLPITLSGYVYFDANDNGVYDSGDSPLPGAQLTLLDANGNSTGMTATTDAAGFYQFDNLAPGTYGVSVAQPAGYLEGQDTAGTAGGTAHNPGNLIDSITLAGGMNAENYDFGELLPASIRGQVFVDLNDDNTFDPGDPFLPNVTIYLLDSSGNRVASTTTDTNGQYAFTGLTPGVYSVEDVQPAAYLAGGDAVGTAGGALNGPNQILNAQLNMGANGVSYNFWELVPATISGYVFQDGPPIMVKEGDPPPDIPALRTGIMTASDVRLSGVTLELCDATGVPLLNSEGQNITAVTNASGYYEFDGLRPGVYSIIENAPSQYLPGIDSAGNEGGMVVNPYAQVSPKMLPMLAVKPSGNAIVQIPINPGDVAVQYNFSHVLVKTEKQQPPSVPTPPPPLTPPLPLPMMLPFVEYEPVPEPYYVAPEPVIPLLFGGSDEPGGYSWHLSVIDAGQPRGETSGDEFTQSTQGLYFDPVAWTGADLGQSQWILADKDGAPVKTLHFGMPGATPVAGDWDGSGTTKIGVFLDGLWFLDLNGNGVWDEKDLWIKLGKKGDQPVAGDWNGDGKTDIGIFGPSWIGDLNAAATDPGLPDSLNPPKNRPKNVPPKPGQAAVGWRTMKRGTVGKLRSDVIDHVFQYGGQGDIAVVGDWNGDGIYTIGIFRNGVWFLDMDGDGRWSEGDLVVQYGQPGDLPVVGDWTGDGISKLGVYRNGTFYLDTNNNHVLDEGDKVIQLGRPGDKPVSGDWDGDGVDKVGVYEDGVVSKPPT